MYIRALQFESWLRAHTTAPNAVSKAHHPLSSYLLYPNQYHRRLACGSHRVGANHIVPRNSNITDKEMDCIKNTFRYNTNSIKQEFTITQTQVRRIMPIFKIIRLCLTAQKKRQIKETWMSIAGLNSAYKPKCAGLSNPSPIQRLPPEVHLTRRNLSSGAIRKFSEMLLARLAGTVQAM